MTSDICSNELCECGHKKEQHNHNTKTGEYNFCSEVYNKKNKCLCKKFTPSPKSNSQQERTSGNIGNVDLSKTNADNTHTLSEIENRIRKEIEIIDEDLLMDKGIAQYQENCSKKLIFLAQLSLCKEFRDMIEVKINEIDLSWFRQIINEKLPLDKSINDFKEAFKKEIVGVSEEK